MKLHAIIVVWIIISMPIAYAQTIEPSDCFNTGCDEGYHCSGRKDGIVNDACCPIGEEYDFWNKECKPQQESKKEGEDSPETDNEDPPGSDNDDPTRDPKDQDPTEDYTKCSIEVCDGLDNDCDGIADDGVDCTATCESCGKGISNICGPWECASLGSCSYKLFRGCEAANKPTEKTEETCNGVDDDSDGIIDNGCASEKVDKDKDGLPEDIDLDDNHWDFYGSLRPGDIILVGHTVVPESINSNGEIDDPIYAIAMNHYSHATLYVGNGEIIDAHPANEGQGDVLGDVLKHSIRALTDNLHPDYTDYPISYRYLSYVRLAVLRANNDPRKGLEISKNAENYYGYEFSLNPIDFLFPVNFFKINSKIYCAELVYRSHLDSGINLFNNFIYNFPWIRPMDLYNSEKAKLIYEIDYSTNEV